MPRIHVLAQSGANNYAIVVHAPVPNQANSAGTNWRAALVNAGLAKTVMTVGETLPGGLPEPGRITQQEADDIAAGAVVEATFVWTDNAAWSDAQRVANLEAQATARVNDVLGSLAARLKYYGFVVA